MIGKRSLGKTLNNKKKYGQYMRIAYISNLYGYECMFSTKNIGTSMYVVEV